MRKLLVYLPIFIFIIPLAYAVPASWYGYVALNGSTASDGVIVDAYISNSIAGTTTVGAVQSSGYYLIHVEGNVGDSVSFRIYGNNVTQAAQTWSVGFQHPAFNLTANYTANGQACPTYSGYTLPTTYNSNAGCAGGYCVHSICRSASTYCGDGHCDTGESASSCSADCGTTTSPSGGGGGGGTSCSESWSCTYWTGCSKEGIQTRICTDANNCGTTTNKPVEEQTCTYIEPEEPEPEEELPAEKEPSLIDIGLIEPDKKYTNLMAGEDKIEFLYQGTSYEINLDKVDDASVDITIPSISASFALGLGESKRIDINNDGKLDVMFILDAITDGNAEVSIVLIEEAPMIEEPEPVEEPEIVPLQIMWSLILVIVLILVFSYLYGRRNRYKRYL
ncbi:hypothetical protein KY361_07555 [Candidatus Woesearchaeota archaeon]|nr:hypothetical protein [Candidatus Woesearchaeota archaeon]